MAHEMIVAFNRSLSRKPVQTLWAKAFAKAMRLQFDDVAPRFESRCSHQSNTFYFREKADHHAPAVKVEMQVNTYGDTPRLRMMFEVTGLPCGSEHTGTVDQPLTNAECIKNPESFLAKAQEAFEKTLLWRHDPKGHLLALCVEQIAKSREEMRANLAQLDELIAAMNPTSSDDIDNTLRLLTQIENRTLVHYARDFREKLNRVRKNEVSTDETKERLA